MRWRNDGGWTREVVRNPSDGDEFDWRVSIAEVEADGPFSAFDGCDRVLVLLDGAGLDLHFTESGEVVRLSDDARVARFAGEVPIDAALVDGPTTDFNVIWRRSVCSGTARYVADGNPIDVGGGGHTVAGVYVVAGERALPDGARLHAGDTVVGGVGEQLSVGPGGACVAFVLVPGSDLDRLN